MSFEVPNQETSTPASCYCYSLYKGPSPSPDTRRPLPSQVKKRQSMSRRDPPKLNLELNLSPPRAVGLPGGPRTESPPSPPSSCVSSERSQVGPEWDQSSSSPEATSMRLVGCPRCLMYVMLAEEDRRCPMCKSTVLLDVICDETDTFERKTGKKP